MNTDGSERSTKKRTDAFVDAAFAFAVSLLIIASDEPLTRLSDLQLALERVPGSLITFILVVMFWLAYRDYSVVARQSDGIATVNALAIVFTVLVYVYPTRLLFDAGSSWVSSGFAPEFSLVRTPEEMASLFRIYGVGFSFLASLYAVLYGRALFAGLRLHVSALDRGKLRVGFDTWVICALTGLVSVLCAFAPMPWAAWLPGFVYWLIPIGSWAREPMVRLLTRRRSRDSS